MRDPDRGGSEAGSPVDFHGRMDRHPFCFVLECNPRFHIPGLGMEKETLRGFLWNSSGPSPFATRSCREVRIGAPTLVRLF